MLDFDAPGEVYRQWVSLLDKLEAKARPDIARPIARAWRRYAAGVPIEIVEGDLADEMHKALLAQYRRTFRTIASWSIKKVPGRKALGVIETKGIVDVFLAQQAAFLESQALVVANGIANTASTRIVKFANGLRSALSRTPGPKARFAPVVHDVAKTLGTTPERAQAILAGDLAALDPGASSERETGTAIQGILAKKGKIVSQARANTIARTETAKAADWAGDEAIKKHAEDGVKFMGRQWVTAADFRVRKSHKTVRVETPEGEKIDTERVSGAGLRDEDYYGIERTQGEGGKIAEGDRHNWPVRTDGSYFVTGLGNRCKHPRDPTLPAADTINCRCIAIHLVDPSA